MLGGITVRNSSAADRRGHWRAFAVMSCRRRDEVSVAALFREPNAGVESDYDNSANRH